MIDSSRAGVPVDPMLAKLNTDVAVLTERVGNTNTKLDQLNENFAKALLTFATKEDLGALVKDVQGIKGGIGWAVKIVIGAIIVSVLGLLMKTGIPHP